MSANSTPGLYPNGPLALQGPRGSQLPTLLIWKAYKVAPDKEFVTYIKDLKSQAEDGHATLTTEELMMRAENKYKAHLMDEENA